MSNKLAMAVTLPQKAASKIQPPPRQSEIIEAMVRLEKEAFEIKAAAALLEVKRLVALCEKAMLAFFKKNKSTLKPEFSFGNPGKNPDGSQYLYGDRCITFQMEILPPDLTQLLLDYHAARSNDVLEWGRSKQFNEDKTRKSIREKLAEKIGNTPNLRVEAMLKSPAIRTALEESLAELNGTKAPVTLAA